MKNYHLMIAINVFLLSQTLFAQWQPDVRLTNNPASSYTSFNNRWCIASSGDFIHVVWYDNRNGNEEIYYKRSTDGGVSWGADTRLTYNSSFSMYPGLAVSGQAVHVVWQDFRDLTWEIYYKRSTDGGISWGADTRLTYNSASSDFPSIAVSGSVVHLVWDDYPDGNNEIYYKRSTDGGSNWGTTIRLTYDTSLSQSPSVSASGLTVHVVWDDDRDGNEEIYYKRSVDGGVSWGIDTRLTNDPAYSQYPSIAVCGQSVHVVWFDHRDGNYEIYYKRSTDAGLSWRTDTRLTFNSAISQLPSVAASGQVVHVVWQDTRDGPFGNDEIYYKRSTNGGASWGTDTRLTYNSSYSRNSSVSVSGSVVHVVWWDGRDGNPEIYYKRDTTGNPTGIINAILDIPTKFKLEQNYPNPFNPSTKIRFSLPAPSPSERVGVRLIIYDVLGREISTLVNEELKPGTYEVDWNASNFPSGIYFYKLITGSFIETKKMILIK